MAEFPDHIFREYDIRGIAGLELSHNLAQRLGQAYGMSLPAKGQRTVVVGRDARLSGPDLQTALIEGLISTGCNVFDIGMVPTPLAYFGVYHFKAAGCIMITGSHNPPEYNGFKMMRGLDSLHGEDIRKLQKMMQQPVGDLSEAGQVQQLDVIGAYEQFVLQDISLVRPLKVVIDAGNGVGGFVATPIYRKLGCEVIELFCEPDGRFPNHHPDPTVVENLKGIIHAVRKHGADFGIAFDGDGDRIGIVDSDGTIIWGDMLLLLLSRHLLQTHPGATIISEVKCSQHMYDDINARGGRAIMWRTGHSPIKAKMKETGALLAGEMSGHVFFADRYFGYDDAIYAGARLMEVVAAQNRTLSSMFADLPHSVTTPEIRLDCPDDRKFALIDEAKEHFGSLGYTIIDVDGMRLKFDDGWALLRASNTQPSLVMRFEAPNESRLNEMKTMLEDWLQAHL